MSQEDGGLFGCRPILCVQSVEESIAYYVGSLGFRLGWTWSDQAQRFLQTGEEASPTFALVGRGQVQIMLSQQSQGVPGVWLHLDVHTPEALDALYAEWSRNGARVVEPPSQRAWGMVEMRVSDLDGHMFRVSAPGR
jgi:uncharacterized glyoxalase superfamily protein PhnB